MDERVGLPDDEVPLGVADGELPIENGIRGARYGRGSSIRGNLLREQEGKYNDRRYHTPIVALGLRWATLHPNGWKARISGSPANSVDHPETAG